MRENTINHILNVLPEEMAQTRSSKNGKRLGELVEVTK